MAKQISIETARKNLRIASQQRLSSSSICTLHEAKQNLLSLDDELDLPPLAPSLDKGNWKEALSISAAWSLSPHGSKVLLAYLIKTLSLTLIKK